MSREIPRIKVRELPFIRIDGGDMVSNWNRVFIGEKSARETADQLAFYSKSNKSFEKKDLQFYESKTGRKLESVDNDETALRELIPEIFTQTFQKNVYVIGMDDPATPRKESQPTFHIDMALTPLDESSVMVGDSSLALTLLKGMSEAERQQATSQLRESTATGNENPLLSMEEANGPRTSSMGDEKAFQGNFDNLAKDLAARGFNVIRLPYLKQPYMGLPIVTYNNVIMENYKEQDGATVKRVFLPVYGISALDNYAKNAYEERGFQVIEIPASAISGMQGAVRCFTQVLERTAS